ncbi:DLAT pyruvate dehydrogenase complex dihydrolipoamide acetyltransferase [Candidatus Phycorickettsia trachydisci]|uniref:Acetyltransferase component of pyruvate dehydrogenase complex n=1 Tax=Candidatus Phycorickettsia trachydisci TaxID=2115978 RepID=A0A2P1P960_9RICK|nr:pyruvate dehydrogenase complex dihydrolipoamide acetyltransferase [Candidatus Phycorickettsia trachydisci]AVP87809.1 DLAT pyruvate dehydrogenase complex dihydrolipoamide acetyltransferase [Candidatus Phycorickettsia trachydisci]
MPINILMPALSPTMTKGNLIKWYKKEGDEVSSGEVIFDVETDKATMEVEAPGDGKLGKIVIGDQSKDIAVGSIVGLLLEDGEEASNLQVPEKTPEPSSPKAEPEEKVHIEISAPACKSQAPEKPAEKVFVSPLAKRMAEQNNINLKTLQGSGPNNRVVKSDILAFLANNGLRVVAQEVELVPHSAMRVAIASRLTESKQTIPHFYLNIEAQVDELLKVRSAINSKSSTKISINDFIIKACGLALKELPGVNSSWSDEGIKRYSSVDVSVAVSVDQGLITPIIKDTDLKSLSNISNEMKSLATRAKENKLKLEEFQGGNFTISNLGMFGIKHFAAIINPPQSCILAVGALNQKPVVKDGQIVVGNVIEFTLSCDHRVVDGVLGAEFLKLLKGYLEEPLSILI